MSTEPLRLRAVVIGVGAGVFSMHRPAIQSVGVEVVGVTDINAAAGQARADELGSEFFPDHASLLEATRPDMAVIVTPHPFHAPIAIDCLRAGAHVLVEKPITAQVAEADAMIDAARAADRLLGVNFQQRTRPDVQAARHLIQSGRLGNIQRVELVAIWTRPAAYYAQADWRGTWAGEGGGVLMNQAPHNLDLLCFLAGQPRRVVAWNRTLLHTIEAEDTAVALLEWDNGALGTLYVTTAQSGEPERLSISGTRGSLELRRGTLAVQEAERDIREYMAECAEPFGKFPLREVAAEVDRSHGGGDHAAVYANFVAAVRAHTTGARSADAAAGRMPGGSGERGTEHAPSGSPALVADGASAREGLELANALIYSSVTRGGVTLPLDRAAYASVLERLKAASR